MNKISQHIVFFVILFLAFSMEASAKEGTVHPEEKGDNCKCCAVSYHIDTEEEGSECLSCCCIEQHEREMNLPERNVSVQDNITLNITKIDHASFGINTVTRKIVVYPIHIIKNSFLFLQVILE